MSIRSSSSNAFINEGIRPTWDDDDCRADPVFESYIERSFPGRVWTFCNRYLSGTPEARRLMQTMRGGLVRQPTSKSEGALFDDSNKTRGAVVVRSQMGTGKTTILRDLMRVVNEAEKALTRPLRVVCVSSRVSFGHTLMEVLAEYGFQMYNMMGDGCTIWDENRLIISMESMHRLQNPYQQRRMAYPDLFIWDEFTCGAIHMKSPTIQEKGVLLDYVTEIARSGHTQFLYMDAYYDSDGLDLIRDMHPNTRVGFLWNVKRPAPRGVILSLIHI